MCGRGTKFRNSGCWETPQGENLEESPDGNKDKESGIIRNIERGFDENGLTINYGRHDLLQNIRLKASEGWRGQGWVRRAASSFECRHQAGGRGGHTLA